MKFALLIVATLAVSALSAPTQITDNNIGDIITVGVKADLELDNKIDATLVNLLASFYNNQKIKIGGGYDYDNDNGILGNKGAGASMPSISPEMIQNFAQLLSQSQ